FDLMATLTRFSAETIVAAIRQVLPTTKDNLVIYISGGGAHNPLLTEWIREELTPIPIRYTDELGIPGDAKEAILFALLANEAICGEPIQFGKAGMPAVTMGKISFPN
ncbi:MAG: anhydro-N-acetylmuramic acid kinase, partial [Chitinophaga rupis]